MRTLLGLLMVLIVSGDEETVEGIFGGSVLLPCTCSDRNEDKEFGWQMDEPKPTRPVVTHDKNTANFFTGYSDRAEIFLQSNSSNCSLLLNNITAEDQGKYRCKFYSEDIYTKSFVQLNIRAEYSVCQTKDPSANVIQCDATGLYGEAEIEWRSDRRPLPTSPPTERIWNTTKSRYRFTSELNAGPSSTAECVIKAKGLPTTITECPVASTGVPEGVVGADPRNYGFLILIPIMAVFGFGLIFLWRRRGFSQRLQKTRKAETDSLYC